MTGSDPDEGTVSVIGMNDADDSAAGMTGSDPDEGTVNYVP